MKLLLTIVLSAIVSVASAQWSNTTNLFYDSLHTAVVNTVLSQKNPVVLTSYPDGGYFVIWEDERNNANTKTDIYAQKYDNAGNALWAAGGVPVSNGPNVQHYTYSSSQDYRSRTIAATDSAGGFYISYSDDSVSNYYWERLMVQHVRSNGTGVFPSPGHLLATSQVANLNFASQLIADGKNGFFIAYKYSSGNDYVYVYDYKDENGTLKFYGGGRVNENAIETSTVASCGIKTDVVYPGTSVIDYNIWPDGQDGCNVIVYMNGNTGSQYKMLCYNRVFRAKKDAKVRTFFRNTSGTACPRTTDYRKGDVYLLYYIVKDYQNVACGGSGGPLYTYTNYRLLANGYLLVDQGGYDYNYPKGVTISTPGNINVDLIAATRRSYDNNVLSDFVVQGYAYRSEIFDSIPYQRCSYSNPDFGYNGVAPAGIDRLNNFRDTLLASSNYYPDFSLSGGHGEIYAAGLMSTTGSRWVRLQHLRVTAPSPDSFALQYNSSLSTDTVKSGVAIGRELNTGFGGSDMFFDMPFVKVAANGTAVFSIRESGRGGRVSPINFGSSLAWGALGKPVASGVYNNSYYNFEQPVLALDAGGGSGIIAWKDNRSAPIYTDDNIYMRHLDQLDKFNYSPPPKRVRLLPNPYGPSYTNPAVLLGSSKSFTTLEVYDAYGSDPGISPVMEIFDNNYLSRVQASVFQNSTSIRKYNGQPYLDRNYTVKTDSLVPGATIGMKLYFTRTEFNALKAADFSIADPGYLMVTRQTNTVNANAPAAYTPVAGEEIITPDSWDSVAGGYSINFTAAGLGNFFVQKIGSTTVCSSTGTSFTSNITGSSYQWQVNTGGANYSNITNGANYSGTNTVTLQLSNIPSSFNGNRYRCVIDNTKVSNAFYLQVADSWTGAISTAWENPGNWGCGKVPDANTDVVISSGSVLVSSNAVCRSLKVSPGATVTVATGFTITVTK